MQEILAKFIQSFQRAIGAEMDAMRASLGLFEVELSNGAAAGEHEEDGTRTWLYDFGILQANDKLAVGMECSLRHEQSEYLVAITRLEKRSIQLSSSGEISLLEGAWTLVLYPWFLYERLQLALAGLENSEGFFIHNALRLFGKYPPEFSSRVPCLAHPELNESQVKAVELCTRSSLAFVWGPPGTGKTMTLGHIVADLLDQGYRVLVTSTTNAAVDQALGKLAGLPQAEEYFQAGQVVRIGQVQGQSFGASLEEVVNQLNQEGRKRREHLEQRGLEIRATIQAGRALLAQMHAASSEEQMDLFAPRRLDPGLQGLQGAVFSANYLRSFRNLDAAAQRNRVERRLARLEKLEGLCTAGLEEVRRQLRLREVGAVQRARLVLSTMTNVYLSKLLVPERFDVVIVEEAGMAILPVLFYCAALAREKVIMVGDPKQLPPIIQARDAYVRQAMGRGIFAVTVPDPLGSDIVVLLETQYRMHPLIGQLVSEIFYAGRLYHGEETQERVILAARRPYPDAALVVVDTRGKTRCTTQPGSYSRLNETSARFCVELAQEAVRDGADSIGIITPYVEQARLIRKGLSTKGLRDGMVECSTVHRFQGNERDMIILDTVDAEPLPPGVLLAGEGADSSAANLLNVSISRARGKLVLVADIGYFKKHVPDGLISRLLKQAVRVGEQVEMPGVK